MDYLGAAPRAVLLPLVGAAPRAALAASPASGGPNTGSGRTFGLLNRNSSKRCGFWFRLRVGRLDSVGPFAVVPPKGLSRVRSKRGKGRQTRLHPDVRLRTYLPRGKRSKRDASRSGDRSKLLAEERPGYLAKKHEADRRSGRRSSRVLAFEP